MRIVSSEELSPLIVNHNTNRIAKCKPPTGTVTFLKNSSSTSNVMQMGSSAPSLHLLSAPNSGILSNSATTTPATSPTPIPIRKLSFSTTPHTKSSSVVTW